MPERLVEVDVQMMTGDGVLWTRDGDNIEKAVLTETNVLIILGPNDRPIAMYNPMVWGVVKSTYEERADVTQISTAKSAHPARRR